MRKFMLVLIIACSVSLPNLARSESLTSTQLLSICHSYKSFCEAYILGIIDGWNLKFPADNSKDALCADGLQQVEARNIVTKYLRTLPENDQSWAANSVVDAIRAAFPCTFANE